MKKLNAEAMEEVRVAKEKRASELDSLITTPFNSSNPYHMEEITRRVNEFELQLNQRRLLTAMQYSLFAGAGYTAASYFLPFTEFIGPFGRLCYCLGGAAMILCRSTTTDFYDLTEEMKEVYTWCLKGGRPEWLPVDQNQDILQHPTIQKLIELLAPVCSIDFMIAWPRVTAPQEPASSMEKVFSAASSVYSYFTNGAASARTENTIGLDQLKERVETGKCPNGLTEAFKYFTTSPDFRNVVTNSLPAPLKDVEQMAYRMAGN